MTTNSLKSYKELDNNKFGFLKLLLLKPMLIKFTLSLPKLTTNPPELFSIPLSEETGNTKLKPLPPSTEPPLFMLDKEE